MSEFRKILFLIILLLIPFNSFATGTGSRKDRSDRKIIEISKIIKISKTQEEAIRKAYNSYLQIVDSSLYKVSDATHAAKLKYDAAKEFHEILFSVLTDQQKLEYIRVTSKPEIDAKTDYKLSLLKEGNEYSDTELEKMREEIFNYLMNEKVVYYRDKYNIKKQKENISRLKNIQPRSLRESNSREKLKGQGRVKNGKVKW